ncbi:putative mRNA capping enzyme alpha subunit [Monocercomonoides exilis]|uniref:putative mRNA capping enzyme alpha subunit n=1 Tax=Monocercomonoides exilis TaxID=2049356 RepID=UPI0035594789|nr:putative mRNA capping enzyme alpha subunit [Monocercomonoides exilis]|eukprot:MONOS_940.1-p1 / transcript=MONOS_940.1 / gene=MONOS_940 / organism=Monocercomonoides_exilis_PA203 / gene_product=mRNA capping enzyme alpha subunit, putative / transcript_product=mRNA capping enzyme alpha subunit, putative / location=Mono_scaffold00015:218036-220743(+) / protein_length=791 / sequence_SO=supercontig / SO=protein_coding / is_pseudo=false
MDRLNRYIAALERLGGVQNTKALKGSIQALLKTERPFPGNHPVSLRQADLIKFGQYEYYVAEKTNGVRFLLVKVAGQGATYLFGRKGEMIRVMLQYPMSCIAEPLILDGELILDETMHPDATIGKVVVPRFYAFDALAVDGKVLVDRDFSRRLGYLAQWTERFNGMHHPVWLFPAKAQEYVLDERAEAFEVVMKKWSQLSKSEEIWAKRQELPHSCDGLVFTPVEPGYEMGVSVDTLLKWKPPELNTVDFLIKQALYVHTEGQVLSLWALYISSQGSAKFFQYVAVDSTGMGTAKGENSGSGSGSEAGAGSGPVSAEEQLGIRDWSVVECRFDPEYVHPVVDVPPDVLGKQLFSVQLKREFLRSLRVEGGGGWRVLQVRTDKESANDERVALSIIDSALNPVSIEDVMRQWPAQQQHMRIVEEEKRKEKERQQALMAGQMQQQQLQQQHIHPQFQQNLQSQQPQLFGQANVFLSPFEIPRMEIPASPPPSAAVRNFRYPFPSFLASFVAVKDVLASGKALYSSSSPLSFSAQGSAASSKKFPNRGSGSGQLGSSIPQDSRNSLPGTSSTQLNVPQTSFGAGQPSPIPGDDSSFGMGAAQSSCQTPHALPKNSSFSSSHPPLPPPPPPSFGGRTKGLGRTGGEAGKGIGGGWERRVDDESFGGDEEDEGEGGNEEFEDGYEGDEGYEEYDEYEGHEGNDMGKENSESIEGKKGEKKEKENEGTESTQSWSEKEEENMKSAFELDRMMGGKRRRDEEAIKELRALQALNSLRPQMSMDGFGVKKGEEEEENYD